jgi:hypothetical protein
LRFFALHKSISIAYIRINETRRTD